MQQTGLNQKQKKIYRNKWIHHRENWTGLEIKETTERARQISADFSIAHAVIM